MQKHDRFAIRWPAVLANSVTGGFERVDVIAPTSKVRDDVVEERLAQLGGSWIATSHPPYALRPFPPGNRPISVEAGEAIRATIADICRVVGIGGGKHLEVCPLGWLSPLVAAVTGFASLTAEDKPLRPQILALLITQYEPNLLLVASGPGAGRARAEGIAKWFGLSTHDRCMLTGMPGERQLIDGKPMMLSGAAMVIARDDPDRLHQLIYGRSARLAA